MPIIEFANGKRVEFSGNPTDADIEEAARQLGISTDTSGTGATDVGMGQGIVQAIAKPFKSVAATALVAGESGIKGLIPGGETGLDVEQKRFAEGYDFGYLGTAKPIGSENILKKRAGEINVGDALTRQGLATAGSIGEIAAYGMSPLAGIGTFAASSGAQKYGEGGDVGESVIEGGVAGLSALAGFGLLKGASSLLKGWGAKLLQSPTVKAAGEGISNVVTKMKGLVPAEMQAQFANGVDYLTNSAGRRLYNITKKEYDTAFNEAKNSMIDALVPEVNSPELSLRNFQNNLAESMGNLFKKSSTLYDDVKANQFVIEAFPKLASKLEGAPNQVKWLFEPIKKGATLRDVLTTYETALSSMGNVDKESQAVIRDLAATLFADTKSVLKKGNPELLQQWELAYNSWLKAQEVYGSQIIRGLKNLGDIDTFRDKMLSGKLTEPQRKVVQAALEAEKETGGAFSNSMIESVLRKVREVPADEGKKVVQNLLDNWGFSINDNQGKLLDDLVSFLGEDFQKVASDIFKPTAEAVSKQAKKLDIASLVDKGDFDSIYKNFNEIRNTGDFKTLIENLAPEEKRVVGLSIMKDIFSEATPLITKNTDGTVNMTKMASVVKKILADVDKLGGTNKAGLADELFTPAQLEIFDKLTPLVEDAELASAPISKFKAMVHGIIASLWLSKGSVAGGAAHATSAVNAYKESGEAVKAVLKLVKEGVTDKNWQLKVGDIINTLAVPVGVGTGEVVTD